MSGFAAEPYVTSIINNVQGYASQAYGAALTAMRELAAAAADMGFTITAPTTGLEPPSFDIPGASIPEPPVITFPSALSAAFYYKEDSYTSVLADAVSAQLLNYILNGGTGLDADVEQAIFDRAVARTELQDARIYEQALNFWASRGWAMPPGAANAMLTEALTEQTRAIADINEKVMIEQARLAQNNTQFAITASINFETQLQTFFSQVMQRAYDSAKTAVLTAIEVYKGQIQGALGLAEVYKTNVEAYAAAMRGQVEAITARIQGFVAQVQNAKANADLQLKAAEIAIVNFIQGRSIAVEAAKGGANVGAQLAAGAVSAAHAQASMSGAQTVDIQVEG